MRILFFTTHLRAGGIPTYVMNLAKGLKRRGHQVVVASSGGDLVRMLEAQEIPHWEVPIQSKSEISPKILRTYLTLRKRRVEKEFDLIHAHTRVTQFIAHWIWRTSGLPYVTTWHGLYRRRWGRRLFPCTGILTIAISENVTQDLQENFLIPPQRIRTVINAVDTEHFSPQRASGPPGRLREELGFTHDDIILGSVSRLSYVKGISYVIHSLPRVLSVYPKARLLIVGDGPERFKLMEQARSLAVEDRIHFIGAVNDPFLFYAMMNLFVFAAIWPEAFGLSLLEAMAMELPIVASRTGYVPNVIQDRQNGLLVPPQDSDGIAQAVLELLGNAPLALQLARAARETAVTQYSLEPFIDRIESVYRETLEKT